MISLALVFVFMACTLASCSTYGSIKKAFEKEGYTLVSADKEKTGEIKTDEGVITYTVHTFQKEAEKEDGDVLGNIIGGITQVASTAVVWEFASDKDLQKAIEESEDIKAILKDAQESDFVNGNCILMTLNADAVAIFKNA
jgi:hypothetical protein